MHDRVFQPIIPTASVVSAVLLDKQLEFIDPLKITLESCRIAPAHSLGIIVTMLSAAGTIGYEGLKELISTLYDVLSKKEGADESAREL